MKNCDTYNNVQIIEHPNAIIRIHRPDITTEERERRMAQIHKAAASLLKEVRILQKQG